MTFYYGIQKKKKQRTAGVCNRKTEIADRERGRERETMVSFLNLLMLIVNDWIDKPIRTYIFFQCYMLAYIDVCFSSSSSSIDQFNGDDYFCVCVK